VKRLLGLHRYASVIRSDIEDTDSDGLASPGALRHLDIRSGAVLQDRTAHNALMKGLVSVVPRGTYPTFGPIFRSLADLSWQQPYCRGSGRLIGGAGRDRYPLLTGEDTWCVARQNRTSTPHQSCVRKRRIVGPMVARRRADNATNQIVDYRPITE
jgi:hypothetical protein